MNKNTVVCKTESMHLSKTKCSSLLSVMITSTNETIKKTDHTISRTIKIIIENLKDIKSSLYSIKFHIKSSTWRKG